MSATNFHAIVKGRETGIFERKWDQVMELVVGFSGARCKGFTDRLSAELWYEENRPQELVRGGVVAYVDGSNTGSDAASLAYVIGEENMNGELVEFITVAYLPLSWQFPGSAEGRWGTANFNRTGASGSRAGTYYAESTLPAAG